ncbi:MAG: thioesterase family protein [Candidatus Nanopelagicales bacterium]
MTEAFYLPLDESAPGGSAVAGVYRSTGHTRGPWDTRHQHAGPPTALLGRAVERLGHAPSPGLLARATVEVLAPIPVADLRVEAHVLREGAKVALCEAQLYAVARADHSPHADDPDPGVPVARMLAWRLRTTRDPLGVPDTPVAAPPDGDGVELPRPENWGGGYVDAVEWRWVDGEFERPGPATVWTRLRVGVVDGEEPTPVQRVLAVADSGSGVSAVADPGSLYFVNTEVSVHLHREPVGDAIWMSAESVLDPHGVGMARSTLGDRHGGVGGGAQTLFLDRR